MRHLAFLHINVYGRSTLVNCSLFAAGERTDQLLTQLQDKVLLSVLLLLPSCLVDSKLFRIQAFTLQQSTTNHKMYFQYFLLARDAGYFFLS